MVLSFIRHTSVDVPKGICYGQTDVPLSATFEVEAQKVLEKLTLLNPPSIVYTSPLSRCRDLAYKCGYPTPIEDPRLMELNFGDWENKKWNSLDMSIWDTDWVHVPPPSGESLSEMNRRVIEFIESLPQSDHIFIFTHGGVLNLARCYFEDLPLEQAFDTPTSFGEIISYDRSQKPHLKLTLENPSDHIRVIKASEP